MNLENSDNRGIGESDIGINEEINLENHLLVIGVDNYIHQTKLACAVSDCKRLVEVLTSKYKFKEENVTQLLDEKATRSNIIHTLISLGKKLTISDSLLIYFAGHGITDEKSNGFWIPYEAEDESSFLHNQRIITYLSQINTLHTLLVSDSCFSGTFFRSTRKVSLNTRLKKRKSRWAITSGRDNQEVLDDSPFAKALINFLEFNDDESFSAQFLGEHLKGIGNNYHQIPQNGVLFGTGDAGGEYVFELKDNFSNAWKVALQENNIELFESYITKYPNSPFIEKAQAKVQSLRKDREGWKNTIKLCQDSISEYTKQFNKSKYYEQAQIELDKFMNLHQALVYEENEQEFWNETIEKDTIESYRDYINRYSKGNYIIIARKKLSELVEKEKAKNTWENTVEAVKKQKDISKSIWALKSYILDFPHQYSKSAKNLLEDITSFKEAIDSSSKEKLREYISSFQTGIYKNRAQKHLKILESDEEILGLIETKSTAVLQEILEERREEFSEEELVRSEALVKMDNDTFKDSKINNSKEAFEGYLRFFPNGIYVYEVRMILDNIDEEEFLKATNINSVSSYEYYLKEFKEGIYINEAKKKLAQLLELQKIEEQESTVLNQEMEQEDYHSTKQEQIHQENQELPQSIDHQELEESEKDINQLTNQEYDLVERMNSDLLESVKEVDDNDRLENTRKTEQDLFLEIASQPSLELCMNYENEFPMGIYIDRVRILKSELNKSVTIEKRKAPIGQVVTLMLATIMFIVLMILVFIS